MNTFFESGLKPEILRAVADQGFETPTPVQAETLALLNEPAGDLIALAQTGTGKTAAFGLPLLHHIDTADKRTTALILCPTRELCNQITEDIRSFATYIDGMFVTAIYGGAPISNQIRFLNKGVQIVVGTPGRVVDMIQRGALKLQHVRWFVLDEADEMLNMGFKDDLETIFKQMPEQKSTWLFSATMPPKVEGMAKRYMSEARLISLGKRNEGAKNVTHAYYVVKASDRFEALKRLIDVNPDFYGVVFCRTRRETNDVARKLVNAGYAAEAINGDLSQSQRDSVMRNFKSKNLRLLVATDVAARGIDVDDLTHVVNYNLPDDPEVYVHRSGRTGRAGKSGICLSILHSRETGSIRDLERMVGKKFERLQVPSGEEIALNRVRAAVMEVLSAEVKGVNLQALRDEVYAQISDMSREDFVEQWIKWAYKTAVGENDQRGDINAHASSGKRDSERGKDSFGRRGEREGKTGPRREKPNGRPQRDRTSFTTLELNIGSQQNLKPNKLMGVINDVMGHSSIEFGRIEIDREKSSIDVDATHASDVAIALTGLQFGSRRVDVGVGESRERTPKPKWKKFEDNGGKFKKPKHKGGKKIKGKRKRV